MQVAQNNYVKESKQEVKSSLKLKGSKESLSSKIGKSVSKAYNPDIMAEKKVLVVYNMSLSRITFQDDETQEIRNIFRPLQVISACTAALAHGGNDVGNAIGPLVLIWLVFKVVIISRS